MLRAARRAGLTLNGDDDVARGKARLLRAAALEDGDDADALGHVGDLRADAGEAHVTLHALQKRLIFLRRHVVRVVVRVGKELVERLRVLRGARELINIAALQNVVGLLHAERLRTGRYCHRRGAAERAKAEHSLFHARFSFVRQFSPLYLARGKKQSQIPPLLPPCQAGENRLYCQHNEKFLLFGGSYGRAEDHRHPLYRRNAHRQLARHVRARTRNPVHRRHHRRRGHPPQRGAAQQARHPRQQPERQPQVQ